MITSVRHKRVGNARILLLPALAIVAVVAADALIMIVAGQDPLSVFSTVMRSLFGRFDGISSILTWFIPLLIIGVSAAFSLRAGLWNVGMEGQLYLGAIFSAWVGFTVKGVSGFGIDVIAFFVAASAGFIWALIPALLRAFLAVNEFITSLLLNFVAALLTDFLTTNVWQDRSTGGQTLSTYSVATRARFSIIFPGHSLHTGLFVAIGIFIAFWYIMRHTALGYRINIHGKNPRFLKYGGGSPAATVIFAMGISGCVSGIAGFVQIYGVNYAFFTRMFSGGIAWDGLAVALLGMLQPVGILLSAVLFGIFREAFLMMTYFTEVSRAIVMLTEAFVLFLVAIQAFLVFGGRSRRLHHDE